MLLPSLIALLSAAAACPYRRAAQLDQAALAEAQQRDDTATRALSNIQIKTHDGTCLAVDPLSGDFRANLTPIQVVECGSTSGQGWDIVTAGKHIDQPGQMLVVSSLTQACFNIDPRRPAGSQVFLFSCGGRADGSGSVTNSQLFAFDGGPGSLRLQPQNAKDRCLFVSGDALGIQACSSAFVNQTFTFGGPAGGETSSQSMTTQTPVILAPTMIPSASQTPRSTVLVTVSLFRLPATVTPVGNHRDAAGPTSVPNTKSLSGTPTADHTSSLPVSRAGGVLNPSAAAESNQFDDTAKRAVEKANIRVPDGRCLSIDPTAGDFRQNLIPVQLAACRNDPNQQFDIITKGKHNDGADGAALIVNVLTNGCVNFDGRRQTGDQVILFSCGGRADGGGQTSAGQLFPYTNTASISMRPLSEGGKTCLIAGPQKLDAAACDEAQKSVFEIVHVGN